MTPNAALISQPSVDFSVLISRCQAALGYSPLAKADASPIRRGDTERYLSALAATAQRSAEPGLHEEMLDHAMCSVLIAAPDRDMVDILAACGMAAVVADTQARGVVLTIISGTLRQWREAMVRGNNTHCRPWFDTLKGEFVRNHLNLWN